MMRYKEGNQFGKIFSKGLPPAVLRFKTFSQIDILLCLRFMKIEFFHCIYHDIMIIKISINQFVLSIDYFMEMKFMHTGHCPNVMLAPLCNTQCVSYDTFTQN